MLAATHAVVGAIIAKSAATPEVGYLAALISHPLLDLFPHWDLKTRDLTKTKWQILWTSLLDAAIGFTIGFLLFGRSVNPLVLALTMFIAQLPDWLEAPLHIFNWRFPPFTTVKKLQHYWHTKLAFPLGIIPQLAIVLLAFFLR